MINHQPDDNALEFALIAALLAALVYSGLCFGGIEQRADRLPQEESWRWDLPHP